MGEMEPGHYFAVGLVLGFILSLLLFRPDQVILPPRTIQIREPSNRNPKIDTLFFPERPPCRNYVQTLIKRRDICSCGNRRTTELVHPGGPQTSFTTILRDLVRAKSIDLCMYRLTLDMVAELLIYLHKQNVRIRVVSDAERMSTKEGQLATNDQIPVLLVNGIQVHETPRDIFDERPALMHDKFVIIDETILYTGSFNWTYQGITKNQESVLRIVDGDTVDRFRDKFNKCWASRPSAIAKPTTPY